MSAPRRSADRHPTPRAFAPAGSPLPPAPGRAAVALAAGLAAALAAAGCGGLPVSATVVNEARAPLDSLWLLGQEDSTGVGPIAPGDSAVVRVGVRDEDAFVLRGRLRGRPLAPMLAVYVEAGGRLRLVVDTTGFVAVRALEPGRR